MKQVLKISIEWRLAFLKLNEAARTSTNYRNLAYRDLDYAPVCENAPNFTYRRIYF